MTQDDDNNFFKRWILINAQANPPEEWRRFLLGQSFSESTGEIFVQSRI
jgi:hypothetical protein